MQMHTYNPVENPPRRFFANIVNSQVANYLCKTAPPQVFDWPLNTTPEQEIV